MNVLILDPAGKLAPHSAAAVRAAGAASGPVCHATLNATPDGLVGWVFDFGPGVQPIRTRTAPDGLACAVLLTCDQFAAAEELVILGSDAAAWAAHFARLGAAKSHDCDVFLSFPTDGPVRHDAAGELAGLMRRAGNLNPGLMWFRSAESFYSAAKQVIRKDARWGGHYAAESVLRELALHDARVGTHGRPAEAHVAG